MKIRFEHPNGTELDVDMSSVPRQGESVMLEDDMVNVKWVIWYPIERPAGSPRVRIVLER